MKLYAKNLRNIDELEQEKRLLLQEKKQLEDEGVLSIGSIVSSVVSAAGEGSVKNGLGAVIGQFVPGIVPLAIPLLRMVAGVVRNRFSSSKEEHDDHEHAPSANGSPKKKGSNPLASVAKELIVGYLKWKAVQLSYKGISLVIKKKKKKRAERAAHEAAANYKA